MKKRVIGLDLIRSLAVIFVICVHFYKNSGFYDIHLEGWKLCIAVIFRWLFFICVPLFIILTGYLKCNKEPNKEHYKSIIPILTSYVFIAIVTILFRINYMDAEITLTQAIVSILNFNSVGNGWYLKMYIGLFMLIPFLNILYKNLKNDNQKLGLIFSLLLICSLPTLTNQLVLNDVKLNIFPDWWINIYPIAYYYIGTFIKDISSNKIKIKLFNKKHILGIPKKRYLLISFIILLVLEGVASFFYAVFISKKFTWGFFGGYYCIITIILSTLFFLLLFDLDIKNRILCKIINFISLISFDIYLFSFVSDLFTYKFFRENVAFGRDLIYYAPLCVLISFGISFVLSLLKRYIFKLYKLIQNKILTN